MALRDLKCPRCLNVEHDRIIKPGQLVVCTDGACGTVMEPLDSAPSFKFGRGFTSSSAAAYQSRERAQLEERSRQYDAKQGKTAREETADRLKAKGIVPDGLV